MSRAPDALPDVDAVIPLDYAGEWPPGSGIRAPNARQAEAHRLSPYADELLYGGARGGGKTDYALAEALRRCGAIPGFQAVFFRRTYKELSGPGGAIPRLLSRVPRSAGRWNATERRWTFWNGSSLTLSYLETLSDVQAWLGLEIQLMVFDQVEQLEEETYTMVRTSLRVTGDVAAAMAKAGLRPAAIATANPGGRGHVWVKKRFIDPFPLGGQLFRAAPTEDEPTPMIRAFVPAKLTDNPALAVGDPTYRARLESLKGADRAAQLDGDWNVFKGARFDQFRSAIHVVKPEDMPLPPLGTAIRGRGIDYGMDAPFVCVWGVLLADDLLYVYREVMGKGMSPKEQAELILASEVPGEAEDISATALDRACWAAPPDRPVARTAGATVKRTGPPRGSIAATYRAAGVRVTEADNRRLEGVARIAARLPVRADGLPRLLISSACTYLIETLPALQRDPKRPEDVDTKGEDHGYDALRYLEMLIGGKTRDLQLNPRTSARSNSPLVEGAAVAREMSVPTAQRIAAARQASRASADAESSGRAARRIRTRGF